MSTHRHNTQLPILKNLPRASKHMQGEKDQGLYIGLMSGTSTDGIDAALFDFQAGQVVMIAHHHRPFDHTEKQEIVALTQPGTNEIDRAGKLDIALGRSFARTVWDLLQLANIDSSDVKAIGSHGQTIRHRPAGEYPFSLQVGNPSVIAQETKITTVADFRQRDLAVGGQGAPLAPAFHQAFFHSPNERRCVINIGGIANISVLADDSKQTLGYDTGPGNVLMDAWIHKTKGQVYDKGGNWAATGQVHNELLSSLLSHEYFKKDFPKSTGREDFHLEALEHYLKGYEHVPPEDVQATLCQLTAQSIANEVSRHHPQGVYVCGGGAHNIYLMSNLQALLPDCKVASTEALGFNPDWVEAGLIAWLAKQTLHSQQGNLPSVTGASESVILGGIYPA